MGTPNRSFAYSNSGYVLLALIIQKISGIPINKFYKEEIFTPLGMDRTFISKEKLLNETNKVQAYNIIGEKADYKSSVIGPGGIYSTINDLTKWNKGLNKHTLVSTKTLKLAFTNGSLEKEDITINIGNRQFGYGFGWMTFTKDNYLFVRHDGSTEGYRSLIRKNLSNKLDVILLTNHGSSLAMDEITNSIDDIIETLNYETPRVPLPNMVINELKENNIDIVIKKLKTTIDNNNKPDERILGRLGFTFQNQKMMNEAIGLFKLNLELHPESTNALYVLGEAYLSENKYNLAKKIYLKFLELKPSSEFAIKKLELIDKKLRKNN